MAIGSDGTGWIDFNDYELARTIGVIALAVILFEGGLSAGFPEIRPVLVPAVSLAVVGTIVTALIAGYTASWLFGVSDLEGLLLGSIVASTDAAAIFSVLRASTLRRKLARTLEGEAGFNDPVAVFLVLAFIDWIQQPSYGLADMAALFAQQMGIGLAIGMSVGWAGVAALARVRLPSAGLYPVASITLAALAFGAADVLHGSGFLAVYLAGLALGSASTPAKRTIVTFHEGLGWVAQLSMFLTLGLLVFPSQLASVALEGTLLALVLALIARPIAAAIATIVGGYSTRERLVIGWAGLRGAVPVVLATFPALAGVPNSLDFFNIVFFAVVVSTLLQGSTFEPLARALGVTTAEAALPRPLAEAGTIRRLGAEVVEFPVAPGDALVNLRVRELGLPREALLNVIVRGNQALPPRGSTRIEAGDHLHILVRQEVAIEFRSLLERWRSGPVGPAPRPRPTPRGAPSIFTSRPWAPTDGNPSRPHAIGDLAVIEQLRTRRDAPGALVLLRDGRYAVAGPVLMIGSAPMIQQAARRRIDQIKIDAERAWWQEVIGALAAP
jgi:potassium/hydrogen antiporter